LPLPWDTLRSHVAALCRDKGRDDSSTSFFGGQLCCSYHPKNKTLSLRTITIRKRISLPPLHGGGHRAAFESQGRDKGFLPQRLRRSLMNKQYHAKAIQAASRFCERRGYEILDASWTPDNSDNQLDLVVRDEETIVFVDVTATTDGGFEDGHTKRTDMESLAAAWIGQNPPEGDVVVRFDIIDMIVVAEDRALLRHHINAYSAVA
jgi:putative endonuclease